MFRQTVLGLLIGMGLQAATIPVTNAGFENPALADGDFVRGIPGWDIGGAFGPGVYNPTVVNYAAGVPEGQNAGFSQGSNTVSQTLAAVVTANTAYTLRIDLGTPATPLTTPGDFTISLLAGGLVLNSFSGTADGAFQTFTVNYFAGAADPHIGDALQIVIQPNSTPDQLDFDNVRLDAVTRGDVVTPEPGAGMLVLLGLAAGAGFRRRFR